MFAVKNGEVLEITRTAMVQTIKVVWCSFCDNSTQLPVSACPKCGAEFVEQAFDNTSTLVTGEVTGDGWAGSVY